MLLPSKGNQLDIDGEVDIAFRIFLANDAILIDAIGVIHDLIVFQAVHNKKTWRIKYDFGTSNVSRFNRYYTFPVLGINNPLFYIDNE